jgi:ribosome production factor 1
MENRVVNTQVRNELYQKEKKEKKARSSKRKRALAAEREAGTLGSAEERQKKCRTLESTREEEPTTVGAEDDEVFGDEADDEFARYYGDASETSERSDPKIMITTRPRPSRELFRFIGDLMAMVPNAFYYPRRNFDVKQICGFAANKKFTHLFVLSEKSKVCNGMIVSHLPNGPTAFFKISNVKVSADIAGHGQKTSHRPEIILNRFSTRLGRRVGRFLGSFFPHDPQFKGRQAVTFHNQRDFIFVRHHRYIFENDGEDKDSPEARARARLQELGPRFTMKLRWLQEGSFDTATGEYEWFHRRKEMDTSRRKFHL